MAQDKSLVVVDGKEIQNMIYTIRCKQVMVDSDLAELYQVTTGNLKDSYRWLYADSWRVEPLLL